MNFVQRFSISRSEWDANERSAAADADANVALKRKCKYTVRCFRTLTIRPIALIQFPKYENSL